MLFAISVFAGFLAVGFFLWNCQKKIYAAFRGDPSKKTNLPAEIVGRIADVERRLDSLESRMDLAEVIGHISIQKVGFMRFNPFHDTGGNNSFILALLDRGNSGIILSSLYLRDGMRLYAKAITNGKSKQPLSDEEKKVLEETMQK